MSNVIDLQERRERKQRDNNPMSNTEKVVLLTLSGYSSNHIAYTLGRSLHFVEGVRDSLSRGVFDNYLQRTGKK